MSGGEKQRVALARAMMRNVPIYIFDEATCHLDFESENLIIDYIRKKLLEQTCIIISHNATRQDNNMTQEEYANKFGVTRQTVSSWENEKSMPDLQLLITICNTYNFSLDSLLNEDHKFVSKIDMTQKIFRTLKRILPIFCIIGCVYVRYLLTEYTN